ncbi:MAG: ribosome biogenesis GTPase Der [Proteobacteria bacterium]|nr:ribosome biogenesis GTPase Der [Pseudomonadota bacterium]MDA1059140.1 ribosome biogenesis GTPase Der [Pseudomonadota bacterium]
MTFTVAIVGRPNVGKSTLFNRVVGRRLAIVDDTPGVTRDWRRAPARIGGIAFEIMDTAGLDDVDDNVLEGRMRDQTLKAIARASVVLFVIDARAGVIPMDRHFAQIVRASGKPVVLVANKCEGTAAHQQGLAEAFGLGLGDPLALSAEHGEGLEGLIDALAALGAPSAYEADAEDIEDAFDESDESEDAEEIDDPNPDIHLTIVGRPNVGKSTLVNRLIGEERVLTGPEAGITRDSIEVDWLVEGQRIVLTDTAGQRKQARVENKLERLAVADAKRSVDFSEVVLLVLDATEGLDKQDLTIARRTVEEGRALLIALNKWDLPEDRELARRRVADRLERSLPQVRGLPVVNISALTGEGLNKLLPAVRDVHRRWNRRVPTAALNRWLGDATDRHPPPAIGGRRIKLRYATQAKARPPTFIVFCSRSDDLPESYTRFLTHDLRDRFDLKGVPVRLVWRKGENPYANRR